MVLISKECLSELREANRELLVFRQRFLPESLIIESTHQVQRILQEGGKRSAPPLKLQYIHHQLITQVLLVLALEILLLDNKDLHSYSEMHLITLERGRAALAPFPTCEFAHVPLSS